MNTIATRRLALWVTLVGAPAFVAGCDNAKEDPDLGLPQTKSLGELKKTPKNEMSKEELEEARRKAGFKDREELVAEAKAAYEASEKSFVKGRAARYRDLLSGLRKQLDKVDKEAPKWAKAKNPDAAFDKFHGKHKEQNKSLLDEYDALTEKGSRGGDIQVELSKVVSDWENLEHDLGPKIAEAEGFEAVLTSLRQRLDEIEAAIEAIAEDESVEPEESDDAK